VWWAATASIAELDRVTGGAGPIGGVINDREGSPAPYAGKKGGGSKGDFSRTRDTARNRRGKLGGSHSACLGRSKRLAPRAPPWRRGTGSARPPVPAAAAPGPRRPWRRRGAPSRLPYRPIQPVVRAPARPTLPFHRRRSSTGERILANPNLWRGCVSKTEVCDTPRHRRLFSLGPSPAVDGGRGSGTAADRPA
jgi:hypothetical protein